VPWLQKLREREGFEHDSQNWGALWKKTKGMKEALKWESSFSYYGSSKCVVEIETTTPPDRRSVESNYGVRTVQWVK
jgi:hypothetical protein